MDFVEFKAAGVGFTVLTWGKDGISIGEWDKPQTVKHYQNAEKMIADYAIGGKHLEDFLAEITIIDIS